MCVKCVRTIIRYDGFFQTIQYQSALSFFHKLPDHYTNRNGYAFMAFLRIRSLAKTQLAVLLFLLFCLSLHRNVFIYPRRIRYSLQGQRLEQRYSCCTEEGPCSTHGRWSAHVNPSRNSTTQAAGRLSASEYRQVSTDRLNKFSQTPVAYTHARMFVYNRFDCRRCLVVAM